MIYDREYALREFHDSGEIWIQQKLQGKLATIFDVGSNIGEWTRMARSYHPEADIHTFEIVPDTYERMLANLDLDPQIIPNGFGLSDFCGLVPVKHNVTFDAMSTTVQDIDNPNDQHELRHGMVFTGDDYVKSRGIDHIDFLKIDVEGHEAQVFKGFDQTLRSGRVKIIQFEYAFINILTKWLLIDSYRLLRPMGYQLGKLKNGSIEFHEYSLVDENFIGPDYLAVHETAMHLLS